MLVDPFGRRIDYLRVSVTDRCDLRCVYCMPADQKFLPKKDVLSLDEIDALCAAFVRLGVRKLRLSGGEPLVRRGFTDLVRALVAPPRQRGDRRTDADHQRHAAGRACRGARRRRGSSGSTSRSTASTPATFARLTRGGDVARVIAGIDAALAAGMKVKLNIVALAHDNAEPNCPRWSPGRMRGAWTHR